MTKAAPPGPPPKMTKPLPPGYPPKVTKAPPPGPPPKVTKPLPPGYPPKVTKPLPPGYPPKVTKTPPHQPPPKVTKAPPPGPPPKVTKAPPPGPPPKMTKPLPPGYPPKVTKAPPPGYPPKVTKAPPPGPPPKVTKPLPPGYPPRVTKPLPPGYPPKVTKAPPHQPPPKVTKAPPPGPPPTVTKPLPPGYPPKVTKPLPPGYPPKVTKALPPQPPPKVTKAPPPGPPPKVTKAPPPVSPPKMTKPLPPPLPPKTTKPVPPRPSPMTTKPLPPPLPPKTTKPLPPPPPPKTTKHLPPPPPPKITKPVPPTPPPKTTKPPPATTPPKTMTPLKTTRPQPRTTTPSPASPTPTTTPSAMTTSERPGIPRYTTVCTVSYLHTGLPLPLSGECDIIYYDSLLLRPEDTFMGTFTNAYLKPIFDAAKESNVSHNTEFGMSVHAPAINDFSTEVKSDAGMQHYREHWQHKVYNWGVLNIHEIILKNTPDILKTSLIVLKELKDIATAAGKNASMVVGLFCKATGGCDKVSEYLKTIYLPDAIVVLGHISFRDNNITDCTILPLSCFKDPFVRYKNLSYMHSMTDAVNTVKHLQVTKGLDTMYALSTTMAGRWYKPRKPDNKVKFPGKYRVGFKCKVGDYPQKAHVQDVCGNKSFEYTEHFQYTAFHVTGFTFDKKEGFTITFETEESLEKKFCLTLDNNTQLLIGIAVYDVNYDAAPKDCEQFKGASWSRLMWVERMRKLLRVAATYDSGQFVARCLYDIKSKTKIAAYRALPTRAMSPGLRRTFSKPIIS
ncbi:uncharacterized protein [Dermacentor andersoni]|uniref:uncharacterized protein isoform X1 n=1 Tax=Dermacentor andersoni TaxID=34620 RepID=UPI003B3AFD72